uniref:BACK domain-containing protein n=1 Tax=Lutzomyia longipalpis TaxID=7200 RepID=A0A1B0CT80_LUTLO
MLEFEYDEIFELLTVADFFLIDGLTERCRDFLKNTLNPKNCVKIFLFAEARFHRDVMEAARKFILVNFLKVMNVCEDFGKLDYEHFNQIISSDLLNVKDELSVWNACLNWINNSPDERKKLIYQLVQLVRMCLMNAEDFQTSIERHPYVLECTKAKGLIDLVKKFHLKSELSQEIFEYKLALPRLPHEVIVTLGGWSEGSAKMEIETYDTRADRWILIGCEDPFGPRAYHGSIAIGEKIYCIGGFNGSEYFNNCRIFDTVTRTWHPMAPMNVRRCYVSVALLNGNIYAMGGFDGSVRHRTCEMYDLKTNLWTFVAQMNSQRSDACATVMDGRIYILGGFNGHECMNTAEVYDAELNAWSLIPQMIHRRSGLKCIAHHGRIYAIGGFNGLVRLKHCEQFNPTTDTWSPIAEMLCPRSNFAIEVIDDMIFVMAGYNGTFTISDVECYVHETDEWMMVTSMNIVRSALSANYKLALPRLPHEVIVTLGGWSEGSAKMEIETYDTRADRWILIGCEDPFGPRAYHGSIAIGEKIYCIGGFNGSEYFNNCRIFDTVTRTWHPMAPMNVRRCYVSVALLNGNIYAMGGFDGSVRHRTCEMYDLKTNLWTFVAQMNSQRSDACATVMDGRIYILGGFNGHECMNTAEVYDAELNAWSLIPQMIHRRSGLKHVESNCRNAMSTKQFAIEVIDDMIFVMAGYNGTFTISDVECYVHETDEWMMATSMNIVRSALSANVIRNTRNIQDYLYPWRAELIEERHQASIHATDSETENSSVQ